MLNQDGNGTPIIHSNEHNIKLETKIIFETLTELETFKYTAD